MNIINHRIELLREEARKLMLLLESPEPGLWTWMKFVSDCREGIDAIMDGRRDDP